MQSKAKLKLLSQFAVEKLLIDAAVVVLNAEELRKLEELHNFCRYL